MLHEVPNSKGRDHGPALSGTIMSKAPLISVIRILNPMILVRPQSIPVRPGELPRRIFENPSIRIVVVDADVFSRTSKSG